VADGDCRWVQSGVYNLSVHTGHRIAIFVSCSLLAYMPKVDKSLHNESETKFTSGVAVALLNTSGDVNCGTSMSCRGQGFACC
jgi:hypothetical protein